MGTLCKNEKRVSRCMGTRLLSIWSRLASPKGSPKNVPNHVFKSVFDFFWSPIGAPELRTPKNGLPQVDAKELPRQSHKTLFFRTYFANIDLRDTFSGRSQCALHVENHQKTIHFITFLTRSLGPTWGTTRNIKSCKMSAALHGSPSAKKKTSAALHGNDFAIWMVQMGPSKQASPKQPKPCISNYFERFLEPI